MVIFVTAFTWYW